MFVADWEPGVTPEKPELTTAPIWLELRDVPLQFFNEEALELIAGQVGLPRCLHPSTANKSNLEVAKVLTLIDPRKPLPEAVNAQFDSGEIRRIRVSSPWMPPVCDHCKGIGHGIKHCRSAPILCKSCNSRLHTEKDCLKHPSKQKEKEKAHSPSRRARAKSRDGQKPRLEYKVKASTSLVITYANSSLGKQSTTEEGETSGKANHDLQGPQGVITIPHQTQNSGDSSSVEPDSSDIDSSEAEMMHITEAEETGFTEVTNRRKKKKKNRGKAPNSS